MIHKNVTYRQIYLFGQAKSLNYSTANAEYWNVLKTYKSFKSPKTLGFSWVTKDEATLHLLQKHFQSVIDTFKFNEKPNAETSTISVDIVTIDQTPYNSDFYINQIPHASVSIGGPSALAMTYFESQRYTKRGATELSPIFSTQSVTESNAYGSALQIHQRYAQRMAYTDSKYEGWNLLLVGLQRLLTSQSIEKALVSEYLTVDFDWKAIANNPIAIADICIRNEWVTWQDKFNRYFNRPTTGTNTYHYAQESARILQLIDGDLGGIFTQEGALSIALTADESTAIANKNKWLLSQHGIGSRYLSPEQLKQEFQLSPEFFPGGGAYYYSMDGHLKYDFWQKLEAAILKKGGLIERWTLKKIVVDKHDHVIGVVVEENNAERFIRTNHVYSSLGYGAQYHFKIYQKPNTVFSNTKQHFVENVTTATGFSGFALVQEDNPKVPIAFNSHHTTRMAEAYDSKYGKLSLVKTTGGALMGSDTEYQVEHAANNLFYNERIFSKFKLFAAKGCSRSINSENSGKFSEFPGLVVGTGRGGKGITDMFADAVVAGSLLRKAEAPYVSNTINTSAVIRDSSDNSFSFFGKKTTQDLFSKSGVKNNI